MKAKTLVALTIVATLGLSGCEQSGAQAQTQSAPSAVEIEAYQLQPQTVMQHTELVGRTVDFRQAEIRPQVSGILQSRLFEEGQMVEKGDLLYRIDPAPFEAALASAKASLAKAEAGVKNTTARAKRIKSLLGTNSVSQQDFDDADAQRLGAQADLAAAKAAVLSAQINLDYTSIRAPISGQIGRSLVTEGALLTANQGNELATIRQLDPIYVDMTKAASKLASLRQAITTNASNTGVAPAVQLKLDEQLWYGHSGELQFSEVSVDPSTSMVTMRAVFPNPDGELLPGMFVRAQLELGNTNNGLLVPQKSVVRTPKGEATVMVVNSENTIEVRVVELAQQVDQSWLVNKGLKAGDMVVTSGLQKIRPGALVKVTNNPSEA
ncbi:MULTISPECIES: efflux RND transporter periplasmic adaptor subunit [unclassified Pseudoalteromonas]|uniref:efflux RND transporter periplasmic adaptor subunit n=1 Tax=unclassified Pseudoalteromonas TaxID=194690 RepID=UPI000CF6B39E|nr:MULTISPECIES: efflux RND transporter periplasmic adaptor subunit [unclassified Pseudoalteromonas]